MRIQPAKMEYVQHGLDGRVAIVTQDTQGIAEQLRQHDRCLQLWYLEDVLEGAPPVYTVWRIHINGRPCSAEEMQSAGLEPEFVLSALECDQRIVKRIEEIDQQGRGGYDYAREVERQNLAADAAWHDTVKARTEEYGEEMAHAIRRDLGERYKGRATPHRFGKPPAAIK